MSHGPKAQPHTGLGFVPHTGLDSCADSWFLESMVKIVQWNFSRGDQSCCTMELAFFPNEDFETHLKLYNAVYHLLKVLKDTDVVLHADIV